MSYPLTLDQRFTLASWSYAVALPLAAIHADRDDVFDRWGNLPRYRPDRLALGQQVLADLAREEFGPVAGEALKGLDEMTWFNPTVRKEMRGTGVPWLIYDRARDLCAQLISLVGVKNLESTCASMTGIGRIDSHLQDFPAPMDMGGGLA